MKKSKKAVNGKDEIRIDLRTLEKHDANLNKHSTLYFQIGLILCLLGTYALFEMQFKTHSISIPIDITKVEPLTNDFVEPYEIEVIKPKAKEPLRSKIIIDIIKVIEDTDPNVIEIIKLIDKPQISDKPVPVAKIPNLKEPDEALIVDFIKVEQVPIYPGCETYKTNTMRKKCMSDKINKLVGRKFNSDIASVYGLKGTQRIHTQFTIDKTGKVTDLKIRAPHPALEKEAKRVINKIPNMKPGLQQEKPVGVVFTLPIKFDIYN